MNFDQFCRLAEQGYNRIPVHREVLADLDTPLSTYLKLADEPYSYLLESVHGGEKFTKSAIIKEVNFLMGKVDEEIKKEKETNDT